MTFSFDTNMVVGLLLKKDRLHPISERLFKFFDSEKREQLVLALYVVVETKSLLQRRINQAIVKVFPVVPELLKISNPASIRFQAVLMEKFQELKKEEPNLSNFYDFVFEHIMKFLKEGETEGIPNFLAELAIEYSHSVEFALLQRAPELQVIDLKQEQFDELLKMIECLAKEKILFKDSTDGEIFYVLILNLGEIAPVTFISDDAEFIAEAKKSIQALVKSGYDMSGFSPMHHSEVKFSKEE